jgi:hypothetical protein
MLLGGEVVTDRGGRRPTLALASVVAGAVLLVACGSSSAKASAALAEGCRTGSGVSAHATTASYVVQLDIGPVETMYTPDQVAAQHLTDGEVMLRGQMAGMGGQPMPGMGGDTTDAQRHLEAHICSKATGAPVQDASPAITLVNDAVKNVSDDVPIAVMQGIAQGVSDYHYGNNVVMAPGAGYTVIVAVNGQKATLHMRLPAAPAGPSGGGASTTMP